MSITIRKMIKDDAEAYYQLRLQALRSNPEAFGGDVEETIKQGVELYRQRIPEGESDNAVFVAEEDGKFIGVIGFLRSDRIKMKHKAHIFGVFVDPNARGKGVGRKLMSATLEHARQVAGLRRVDLSVVSSNAPALALYQSFGFEIWGTEPEALCVNGIFYDEYYMSLNLKD